MLTRFVNRREAGQLLARRLDHYSHRNDVTVLALPRGGVPVAFEVANYLRAPLDVFVVRKLGVPGHEELAMGAIATGGVQVLNESVVKSFQIPLEIIAAVAATEMQELARRQEAYGGERPPTEVRGRTIILVDDGVATGSTMRVAIQALRQLEAGSIVVAVPTAAPSTARALATEVDDFVALMVPAYFDGVGQWYEDFSPTSDDEVQYLLQRARQPAD